MYFVGHINADPNLGPQHCFKKINFRNVDFFGFLSNWAILSKTNYRGFGRVNPEPKSDSFRMLMYVVPCR